MIGATGNASKFPYYSQSLFAISCTVASLCTPSAIADGRLRLFLCCLLYAAETHHVAREYAGALSENRSSLGSFCHFTKPLCGHRASSPSMVLILQHAAAGLHEGTSVSRGVSNIRSQVGQAAGAAGRPGRRALISFGRALLFHFLVGRDGVPLDFLPVGMSRLSLSNNCSGSSILSSSLGKSIR